MLRDRASSGKMLIYNPTNPLQFNRLLLKRPQFAPAQRVHDVVLDERIELVEGTQSGREISSTEVAGIALRSSVLSSSSRIVSR